MKKYFDYMFYCTYHFMMKIRKTEDRVDDVIWIFSSLFSAPLFGFIFQLWGFLFEKGIIGVRPKIPVLGILSIILVLSSIYLTDRYFTKNERYKQIFSLHGKKPSKKDIIIGFFSFLFSTCILGIVVVFMFFFMKLTH